MSRGIFITFEGGDGSGKSTQIELLKTYLEEAGKDVILTREPGGTSISEKIRELILDKNNTEMDDMTETLLYSAARAQLVSELIRPALEAGKVVICDRFVDSSMAYQGFGRGLGNMVWDINSYAIGDCIPDLTILLKVEPEVGISRIGNREKDRIELAAEDFHKKVYEGYLALEELYPDRIVGIEANRSIEEISEIIRQKISEFIG